jgi:hypothetical protein
LLQRAAHRDVVSSVLISEMQTLVAVHWIFSDSVFY